jgi:hypothetical protein
VIRKKSSAPSITLDEAIQFVESQGYLVIQDNVPTPSNKEIVTLFYQKLNDRVPQEAVFLAQSNESIDMAAIERFQRKARTLGIKKAEANQLLYDSIKDLFVHFDKLGLTTHPRSLSFLTTDGSWIFKKLLEITYKNRIMYVDSDEAQDYFDAICESEDEAYLALKAKKTKQLLGE